jgi:hypothetical protein
MMPAQRLPDEVLIETLRAFQDAGGIASQAALNTGVDYETFRSRLRQAKKLGVDLKRLEAGGRVEVLKAEKRALPRRGQVKRYILTSIQNNTHAWQGFNNLIALAHHYDAELLVGTYTYQKAAYGMKAVKRGTLKTDDFQKESWYDPAFEPYICDKRVQLAPGLVWCGEMNIMPTATDPLSGLETYAGRQSCIFPHSLMEMRSIASAKFEGTKLNYTTGTSTQRNYIAKKAGLKADFAHCYGAVIAEVCDDGTWFVRQLHAGDDDSVYDLDLRAQAGTVEQFRPSKADPTWLEAIEWGDIHEIGLEDEQRRLCWGKGGLIDFLRPRHQFMNDVLDFRSRNHHDRKNPHIRFLRFIEGTDNVRVEVTRARNFLMNEASRPWCQTVVKPSNHDLALERWTREADYREDPTNALFFLELQLAKYRAIEARDPSFYMLEHAVGLCGGAEGVRFLREDESFVICRDALGGIECGMHGHLGTGGKPGTPYGLSKLGRATTIGDKHSAGIYGRLYVAGVTGNLDMSWNKGPSSWTHSHVLTYANGRRAIVTSYGGRCYAPR